MPSMFTPYLPTYVKTIWLAQKIFSDITNRQWSLTTGKNGICMPYLHGPDCYRTLVPIFTSRPNAANCRIGIENCCQLQKIFQLQKIQFKALSNPSALCNCKIKYRTWIKFVYRLKSRYHQYQWYQWYHQLSLIRISTQRRYVSVDT